MTDFIHEAPKEETPVPAAGAPEEELDEKTGQKRVYGYILLLFIVAFSLLLWSFLMNQRSNEEVLSELRGNAHTIQSTLDRNLALETQLRELSEEKEALEDQAQALEKERGDWQKRAEDAEARVKNAEKRDLAMDLLLGIQQALAEGREDLAKAYAQRLEDPAGEEDKTPLKDFLPNSTQRHRISGDREADAAALYARLSEELKEG